MIFRIIRQSQGTDTQVLLYKAQMLHGAGIFTYIYPKNGTVL